VLLVIRLPGFFKISPKQNPLLFFLWFSYFPCPLKLKLHFRRAGTKGIENSKEFIASLADFMQGSMDSSNYLYHEIVMSFLGTAVI
jgi:hypothetical protein